MNKSRNFPIVHVLEGGYCIGCGGCAAIDNAVSIKLDPYGLLKPEGDFTRGFEASDVCPFSAKRNEDEIGAAQFGADNAYHDDRIGYFQAIFVGHVSVGTYRNRGGSSGFVTWLLVELMERGLIDGVIHLKSSEGPSGRLFEYGVSSTIEEVVSCAKSKYYPSHFDEAVKKIKGDGRRYAFVGVPCFVKSVRLLCESDEVLSSQIVFCIALFCGHMKSTAYAEFISGQIGIPPGAIKTIDFRVKDFSRPANRYSVSVHGEIDGEKVTRTKPTSSLYGMDWGLGYFKPKSCEWCDDIVGELADVSSGDAWLPTHVTDPGGNNIVVVRSSLLREIVLSGIEDGELLFSSSSPEDVFASQAGNYRHRREGLAVRVIQAEESNQWHPTKRIYPDRYVIEDSRVRLYEQRGKLSEISHELFLKSRKRPLFFAMKMLPHEIYYYHLSGRLARGTVKVAIQLAALLYRTVKYKILK